VAEPAVQEGRCRQLEWAVCATSYPRQRRSGDAFLVRGTAAGVLVAVVDGLGHGEEAADVAERALASLRKTAGEAPTHCVTACHRALRGSRGVALTVAAIDPLAERLVWVAVGNVEAAVLRRGRNGAPTTRLTVPLRGGVVGDRLPPLRESTAPLAAGDHQVCATDGLAPAFLSSLDVPLAPPALARRLHAEYARADDDALVLVARRNGRSLTAQPSCS
jgi:negative regulator of sigma-B (phosphoserine phosphatase)